MTMMQYTNCVVKAHKVQPAIPRSTQLCRRLAWPPTSTFCWHQPSGSAAG